jgi:serine/threonine protein phosphatase PrpC
MNIHTISLIGKRESNEDQHIVFPNSDGRDPKLAPVNVFCIFDGHGGNKVSKYLREHLFPYLVHPNLTYPLSKLYINKVYNRLQNTLATKFPKMSEHCGSTCLVAIHFKKNGQEYIQVINVGDCRAVLNRDNIAIPLTRDHKPNWVNEKTRITQIGGADKMYYDGVDWRVCDLSVSRAFGDVSATPYVTHNPDIFRYKSNKNDKFLILACDGLWDVLSNDDAVHFVLEQMCYDKSGKKMVCADKRKNVAKSLAEHAIKKGSTDNITVILVFLR